MGSSGGSYSYEEVHVVDLQQPIKFTIPYYQDGPIEDAACAYFDVSQNRYMALECTSAHHNIGINNFEGKFMKCCSNHATAFTVMEKELLV